MTDTNVRALFAVSLSAFVLFAAGCKHVPTEEEKKAAEIHYDLGIQAQNAGNMQEAYGEFERALKLDPKFSQAHHAMGLVLHLGFARHQEAIGHFEEAIRLDPAFSDAKVNLGNVFLDSKQYDKAAALYQEALNDMKYATPFIALGNLGMAEYRRGNTEKAIDHLKSAVTTNPKFCLGYRNLGLIYDETGKTEDACVQYGNYREQCPDTAEAYYREGLCLAKTGDQEQAVERFAACEAKASVGQLKDDCRRLLGQLQ